MSRKSVKWIDFGEMAQGYPPFLREEQCNDGHYQSGNKRFNPNPSGLPAHL